MALTEQQAERYGRHLVLGEIGAAGQEKILRARVLIVGLGGLGSPVAFYLAAAGVGVIGLADGDLVDLSNLQRQILHASADIGRPKVVSAREKLAAINPDVMIETHQLRLDFANAREIISRYDLIIDCTDNFPARFLVNDACVLGGKPFSHAAILRLAGQAMTWRPGAACFRCLFRRPPPADAVPSGRRAGVLGAVAGLLGTIQAAEALRFILGRGRLLTDRLLTVNALDMEFRTVTLRRAPDCPLCGENPAITELADRADYRSPARDLPES